MHGFHLGPEVLGPARYVLAPLVQQVLHMLLDERSFSSHPCLLQVFCWIRRRLSSIIELTLALSAVFGQVSRQEDNRKTHTMNLYELQCNTRRVSEDKTINR